jgi:hypothetical protein
MALPQQRNVKTLNAKYLTQIFKNVCCSILHVNQKRKKN